MRWELNYYGNIVFIRQHQLKIFNGVIDQLGGNWRNRINLKLNQG